MAGTQVRNRKRAPLTAQPVGLGVRPFRRDKGQDALPNRERVPLTFGDRLPALDLRGGNRKSQFPLDATSLLAESLDMKDSAIELTLD